MRTMNETEKETRSNIIKNFHLLHYYEEIVMNTYWLGNKVLKTPEDLMMIQEIIYQVGPDLIIETGTYQGGSALFMANVLDLIGKGRIITVDKKDLKPKEHPRITYLIGSSLDTHICNEMIASSKNKKVLVLLDSAHTYEHVKKELEFYSKLVSKDSYLICEDTNLSGNPVEIKYTGGGPMEAVKEFIKENDSFIIDKNKEKYLLTYFPNGFLKRIKRE